MRKKAVMIFILIILILIVGATVLAIMIGRNRKVEQNSLKRNVVINFSTTQTITDADQFYELVDPSFDKKLLLDAGFKTVEIKITLEMKEQDDGYQDLWVKSASGKSIASATFEHGSGYKKTSWGKHTKIFTVMLVDLSNSCAFNVQYGAHGHFSDDWTLGDRSYEVIVT